jgi:hypothetical protein
LETALRDFSSPKKAPLDKKPNAFYAFFPGAERNAVSLRAKYDERPGKILIITLLP